MFANPKLATQQNQPIQSEQLLVLVEFEYTDPDGDGIYTAELTSPLVSGEYEIITLIDYESPQLGTKELRMVTVVDPEGYVYEKSGGREIRIPGAVVSLYWLNLETKKYQLWPGKNYNQENPQATDVSGTYSFIVPEGFYYLMAEAPSYRNYTSRPFQVKEGSGVHINIELKTRYGWFKNIDWKTGLLIILLVLLLYNFYQDRKSSKIDLNKIR